MATKKQLAEQVLLKLSGGNIKPDSQIDIREIMLDMDQIRDSYVKMSYYNNMKQEHYTIDQEFLSLYQDVAVTNTVGLGYNFTLPAKPIALPRNVGIHSIYETNQNDQVIIIDALQSRALKGRAAINITGKLYVYFQGGKGIFTSSTDIPATLNMLIVASSKDIAEDAEYPMTPDGESELLEALFQKYTPHLQIPHDEREDGQKQTINNG